MDDFAILIGVFASASLGINIYLIKSVASLCERVAVLQTIIGKQG